MRKLLRGRLELFHRVTLRARATRESLDDAPLLETGSEQGVAVRVAVEGHRTSAFAAASGGDETAVGWALERASRNRTWSTRSKECEWAEGNGKLRLDLDPGGPVQGAEALDRWLTGVLTDLGHGARGWVEAGLTIESLVNDLGLSAVRLRRRAWASLTGARIVTDVSGQIRTFVGEDLASLASGMSADRALFSPGDPMPAASEDAPLLLEPEAAATMARGLAQALHRDGSTLGLPVGPGWKLVQDPQAPDSPFAATFDDAGFEAGTRVLADGREVTGVTEGPGFLRRPSFRDPPEPLALNLVVTSEPQPPPASFLAVADLRIHGGEEGDWLLELQVRTRGAGKRAREETTRRFLRVRPEDLVKRVAAAVGRARPTAKGVNTPGLVLDGLRLAGG